MKKLIVLLITACAFIAHAAAEELLPFYILPYKNMKDSHGTMSHNNHGGHTQAKMYQLVGFNDLGKSELSYYLSNLEQKSIFMSPHMVHLPKSMYDNYHALVANVTHQNHQYSAVYYIYKFGKPSHTSPTKLTHMQKSTFEIIPDPLPREHDKYYGSKTYSFLLRFRNKPLANQTIKLTTLNGSITTVFTDNKGEFQLRLPNDFKNVKDGRNANKPSYFIISANFSQNDQYYHTTFTNPYYVNPNDYWSSIHAGIGVLGLGLLSGLFLLWRRQNG